MLVITRKVREKLLIGDAEVTVLSVQGYKVRLGIVAPKDIRVIRFELTGEDDAEETT